MSETAVEEDPANQTTVEEYLVSETAVEEDPVNETTIEEYLVSEITVEEEPASQTVEAQHVLQVSESDIEYESRIKRMISIIVYLQKSVAEENALSNDVITAIEHALPNIEYK